jgi:hypothetical protein
MSERVRFDQLSRGATGATDTTLKRSLIQTHHTQPPGSPCLQHKPWPLRCCSYGSYLCTGSGHPTIGVPKQHPTSHPRRMVTTSNAPPLDPDGARGGRARVGQSGPPVGVSRLPRPAGPGRRRRAGEEVLPALVARDHDGTGGPNAQHPRKPPPERPLQALHTHQLLETPQRPLRGTPGQHLATARRLRLPRRKAHRMTGCGIQGSWWVE